jgi:sugar phosphate isomerase/epimerase
MSRSMKFAICNELFEGWEFERVCRFVKSIGYDGLEIAPFTLAPRITDVTSAERARLRRLATESGVEILGLHWLLAKTDGFHVTSPDLDVRRRTAEYLVDLARACHDLGGHLMVFGSPKQRSRLPGVTAEQAEELAAETFRQALPAVADLGVTICLEPLSADETDVINTCAAACRLIQQVNHPHFGLHLDVKAMSSEAAPVTDLVALYGGRASHFHANDPNLRGPGFGATDFIPIFKALAEAGYDRWVSVEVFDMSPDPETVARGSIEYMSRCLWKELTA